MFGCIEGSNCRVGLKTHNNTYVAAEGGGQSGEANANQDQLLAEEIFSVTFLGFDKVGFKGHHGKYLVAERNGAVNGSAWSLGNMDSGE